MPNRRNERKLDLAKLPSPYRFRVWYGSVRRLPERSPPVVILITPSDDPWNDFGNRTLVSFSVWLRGEKVFEEKAHFGFLDDKPKHDVDHLRKMIERRRSKLIKSTHDRQFTMLLDMESYRRIVRELGADGARRVLVSMNDVVVEREFRKEISSINRIVTSEVFSLSFIRTQDAYFAFKNAGRLLRGLQFEEVGGMSPSFTLNFRLQGLRNSHHLTFRFDHKAALPKRIAIVIGKNGVGKSQVLGRIAHALVTGSGDLTESEGRGRVTVSRLLAFAPNSEAGIVFPSDRIRDSRIWYRRLSLNRDNRTRRGDRLADLLVQVARSDQSIKRRTRWDIFLGALEEITGSREICLADSAGTERAYIPLTDLNSGSEKVRLETLGRIDSLHDPMRVVDGQAYALSSGEISFLKFAAQVSLSIENSSLVLLDEPETHLHPNFISRFVALLDRVLADTGSAAIIATHSAYFVREVFREQVTVLRVDEKRMVHSEHPILRTFGSDVGAISCFVFGEDDSSPLASQVRKRLLSSGLPWKSLLKKYKDDLSLEFLNSLRAAREGSRE